MAEVTVDESEPCGDHGDESPPVLEVVGSAPVEATKDNPVGVNGPVDQSPIPDALPTSTTDPGGGGERPPGESPNTRTGVAEEDAATRALDDARPLLESPKLLDQIARAIADGGFAGDKTPAILVYLAITSRLLDRPLNLVLVGPSAAGKNRAVKAAVALVPPDAVYEMSSASPRALIYSMEPLQHRTIVMGEADALPGSDDGSAASAIRSIIEDARMVYDTVKDQAPLHIEREGPTGLVTTSTKSLPPQLGTRILEIPVADDPTQIRAVLHAHARTAMGSTAPIQTKPPDLAPFLALQHWLVLAGERHIVVPFADVLATLVPAQQTRMNRDFGQLLTCIRTLAMLRQRQRARTPAGEVIATIEEDYAKARDLLSSIFDAVAAEGVTLAIRTVVEAVPERDEVSVTAIARTLGRSKSATSERVKRAVAEGWLINLETQHGRPARIRRGTPLPSEICALPTVKEVRRVFGCPGPLTGVAALPSPQSVEASTETATEEGVKPQIAQAGSESSGQGSSGDDTVADGKVPGTATTTDQVTEVESDGEKKALIERYSNHMDNALLKVAEAERAHKPMTKEKVTKLLSRKCKVSLEEAAKIVEAGEGEEFWYTRHNSETGEEILVPGVLP